MKKTKKEDLLAELERCEGSILFYTPIYEANIDQYNYCHNVKKTKQFNGPELDILKLQEEQSRKIITKYKYVMKYLKKKRLRLRKKLGIKDNTQTESQPGEE